MRKKSRRKEVKRNDLFEIVFKLSSDWTVQLWRWLCGDASDPGTGSVAARLAYDDRIHRFDHDFPDDTWANCDQCGNICRQQDCGSSGICCGDLWVILPSCIIVTLIAWFYLRYKKMKMFQSVLESLRPAVVALIASAGIAILHTAFWTDGIVQFAATKWFMVVIFGICLLLLRKTKLNPVVVMMLAGVMNVAVRYAAG